ncbi:MAG: hypothetical protein IJR66_05655 [Clostridia bacterium]|nr:hypothetical protein [Clostridia bacterium]
MMQKEKKTYDLTDLFKNGREKTGVIVKDKKLACGFVPVKTGDRVPDPEKIYHVSGKTIVYCKDGFLRVKGDRGYKKFTPVPFNSAPMLFEAINNGKQCVAIRKASGIMLISDKTDYIKCEDGDLYYTCFGRTFIGKDNLLKIIDEYDFYSGNEEKDVRIIVLSEEFGKIIALSSYKNALVIVCKKKILSLTFDGNGLYSLENRESVEINVEEKTVKKAGDKIFFLSQNNLYYISDKTEKINSLLSDRKFTVLSDAFTYNGCYFLPIKENGENKVYVYDANRDCDYFIKAENLIFSDGGLAVDTLSGFLYRLEEDGDGYREIKSETTDFDVIGKKHLVGLSAYSEYPVSLKIEGDFGASTFNFNGGEILFQCNLYSGRFTFTFYSETKIAIENAKIIVG